MYFKKLELIGFKSFADKTTLNFEPGITAVVGPNGTGKSNVFDSIRWVLGEQSVKALRGSKMEDVIFNGTDKKEPLNFAQVSLTFSNSSRILPIEHEEVDISRRIYRSGESEYFINGTGVRLKDITELLMGTGIGAESYTLIEQGKIDLILSSRPEDRRLVFDEAAGITKYKTQKKESIRKLKETEENITRINDIILEVKRQISSLERQANRARRYKELFEELKDIEVQHALRQINNCKEQIQILMNAIQEQKNQQNCANDKFQEINKTLQNLQQKLSLFNEEILEKKNKIVTLQNSIQINNQHITINNERIEEFKTRKQNLENRRRQIQEKRIQDEEKVFALDKELQELKDIIKKNLDLIGIKEKEQQEIERCIKESKYKIKNLQDSSLVLATQESKIKNEIQDSMVFEQNLKARKKRLDIETAKVNQEKNKIEEKFTEINSQADNLKKEFNNTNLQTQEVQSSLIKSNLEIEDLNKKVHDFEKRLFSLISQREFLQKLQLKYEEIPDVLKAVILLDEPPKEKVSCIIAKLQDLNKVSDEEKSLYPGFNYKVSCKAKSIPSDINKISKLIEEIEQDLKNSRLYLQERLSSKSDLEKKLADSNDKLRNIELELNNKQTILDSVNQELSKINQEKEITEIELKETSDKINECEKGSRALHSKLEEINNLCKDNESQININKQIVEQKNTIHQKNIIFITELNTQITTLKERVNSQDGTLRIFKQTLEQDNDELKTIELEFNEFDKRLCQFSSQIKDIQAQIATADGQKQNLKKSVDELEIKRKEIANEIDLLLPQTQDHQKIIQQTSNQIHNLELEKQKVEFSIEAISSNMRQTYNVDIYDSTLKVNPELDPSSLVQDIERLKTKLNSYGNVNLVAIEEYDELKKRYDFLTRQQQDLINSKESLHSAIAKINRTTRKLFLETFSKLQEEFKKYFRLLFGGGQAQLYLLDENDILESGIEIICRPPGKRLQNVLLLSGGEKALSAIALLFSLFKVKPSPFCILDEIDAALDEVNIERFSRLLKDFSNTSQFIVITHNKRTIANADVMYGITMQDSGVSKIVSVKFAENKVNIQGDRYSVQATEGRTSKG